MSVPGDPENAYVARRRRRRRWWLGTALAALVLVVVTARRPDLEHACAAPEAAPAAELSRLPTGLSFARIGTVTAVSEEDSYVTVNAVTTKPLDQATVLVQEAVVAAGYRFAGMDSEGFEAEVFFTTDAFAAGQARIEQSACAGRWDVELVLLDLDAARASRG